MHREALRRLYDLHSWIGLTLGLLLYVVSFSGVIALFAEELDPWLRADLSAPPSLTSGSLDSLVDRTAAGGTRSFLLLLPNPYRPWVTVIPGGRESAPAQRLDPATLAPLPARGETAAEMLTRLHTDLLLPQSIGRYIVGLLGIALLASAISGLLLHRKMLQEMFSFRPDRSIRLFWTDMHKLIGLWAAPFHVVMALTGTILGFAGIVVLLAALTAYRGDGAAAMAAMGMLHPSSEATADMVPASRLMAEALRRMPGMVPEVVDVADWGQSSARLVAMGNLSGRLVYYPSVSLSGASGEVTEMVDWSREGVGRRLYAMVTPLHYGSFGGVAVKLLYAALGISMCVLAISGLRIWRSRLSGAANAAIFTRLMTGTIAGLAVAAAVTFFVARLMPSAPPTAYPSAMAVFLVAWAAAMFWSFLRGVRAGRDLSSAACVLLIGFPFQTLYLTAASLPQPASLAPIAAVDLSALITGIAGLILARRIAMPAR
ncbi:MAG: PepSY-associated TM helix domain-containing protein [Thalassobaculaceae bacterium]|nr:PepSY-associated TM helix domain-containing protein [Thalassobaculaceae bacterium]